MSDRAYAAKLRDAVRRARHSHRRRARSRALAYLPRERARAGAGATRRRARRARARALSRRSRVPLHACRSRRAARRSSARVGRDRRDPASASRAPTARSRARCAPRRARSAGAAAPTASRSSFRAIASSAAMGSLGGFMNARRRRSARDQALAADARGLPLRQRDGTHRRDRRRRRTDRRVLRPALAAGRPRAASLASYRRDLAAWAAGSAARGARCCRRRAPTSRLARRAVPRQGESDVGRAAAFVAAALLSAAARARARCARTRRCACARRSCRGGCRRILSETQVEALLAAPDVDTTLGLRDRAMLETLYATGLRVSELVGLKLAQVSLDVGVVRVIGKGSKERLVPLGDEASTGSSAISQAARAELAGDGKSDHVFLTARRGPLTRQAFWALIKRYAMRAGIPRRRCRRTCCATRSRRICSTTAPICASCSCCSATPTSRRRRSTRTSRASG